MSKASYDLGNGLSINAENPETHVKPEFCKKCKTFYYFGGHYCIEENKPSKAFKRGMQGYYDGE